MRSRSRAISGSTAVRRQAGPRAGRWGGSRPRARPCRPQASPALPRHAFSLGAQPGTLTQSPRISARSILSVCRRAVSSPPPGATDAAGPTYASGCLPRLRMRTPRRPASADVIEQAFPHDHLVLFRIIGDGFQRSAEGRARALGRRIERALHPLKQRVLTELLLQLLQMRDRIVRRPAP